MNNNTPSGSLPENTPLPNSSGTHTTPTLQDKVTARMQKILIGEPKSSEEILKTLPGIECSPDTIEILPETRTLILFVRSAEGLVIPEGVVTIFLPLLTSARWLHLPRSATHLAAPSLKTLDGFEMGEGLKVLQVFQITSPEECKKLPKTLKIYIDNLSIKKFQEALPEHTFFSIDSL